MARLPLTPRITQVAPAETGLEVNQYIAVPLTTDIPCESAVPELDTQTNTLPVYPKRSDLP